MFKIKKYLYLIWYLLSVKIQGIGTAFKECQKQNSDICMQCGYLLRLPEYHTIIQNAVIVIFIKLIEMFSAFTLLEDTF